jgi:hypothetical protein
MSEAAEEMEQEELAEEEQEEQSGAESASDEEKPDEGGEGEGKSGPKTLPPETQENINARINKEVFRRKELERELAEERRLRAEHEAKNQPQRPEVPPLPSIEDQYDDDYGERVQAHYAAKAQADLYDLQEGQRNQQEQYQAWQAQQKEQQEREALANEYYRRGDNLGYDRETLDTATGTVVSFGLDKELGRYIVADESGPAVTMYLASNPAELEKVSQMSPIDGAVYIATEIKGKALESRPKVDVPEDPGEELSGTGMARGDGGPDGATYE